MRISIVLLIPAIAVLLSGCSSELATDAVDITVDEEAIRAVSAQWFELARQKDAESIANLFANDGQLVWPGQDPIEGRAAVREAMARNFSASPVQSLDWSTDRVVVAASGDLAVVYGTYSDENLGLNGTGEDRGNYVTVYRKVDGTWKISTDISASTFSQY
jgi:uncharacterized protein (TIGR02246 family)